MCCVQVTCLIRRIEKPRDQEKGTNLKHSFHCNTATILNDRGSKIVFKYPWREAKYYSTAPILNVPLIHIHPSIQYSDIHHTENPNLAIDLTRQ